MTLRVCLDCPELTDRPRCPTHRRAYEQARGTPSARGYGRDHQAKRADYQRRMDAGETFNCWRCDRRLSGRPDEWQLGHDDQDRSQYRGPECVPCNTATAGR